MNKKQMLSMFREKSGGVDFKNHLWSQELFFEVGKYFNSIFFFFLEPC